MHIIVFSPHKSIKNEVDCVVQLFKNGLKHYHLKKPHYSFKRMEDYISSIPEKYHNRIVVHSHHSLIKKFKLKGIHFPSKYRKSNLKIWWTIKQLKRKRKQLTVSTSFHNSDQLQDYNESYNYVFLSPIFDSITKQDYQSGFTEFNLSNVLINTQYKVVALGGIDETKIQAVNRMGFYGCAVLGNIWTSTNPTEAFLKVKEACEKFK